MAGPEAAAVSASPFLGEAEVTEVSQQQAAVYRVILTAVDLGPITGAVVEKSVRLAERLGAEVELVHVHEGMPTYATDALLGSTLSEVSASLRSHALDVLEQARAVSPVVRSVEVFFGNPTEKIYEAARSSGADLVCIGAHAGRGLLLPNRCTQVLHHADRDVLVMKVGEEAGGAPGGYRHILVALDFSEASRVTLARAAALAGACGSRLTLAHIIDHFPVDRSNELIAPEDLDPLAYERQQSEQRLRELAQATGIHDYAVAVLVSDGTAKREISVLAAEDQVDLIVVGSHGRHGIEAVLGSVAIGVVHRAGCDVLVVRAVGGG
jgi:universal stress protein A